ncbi:MAG TPA: HEAT repeat domain-containing protein [Rubrobacter sp.]|nr:HEAT repeat domain-containing protein [Rubrobacter sp.]
MSQSLSLTLWAVAFMVALNVLMVALTIGTKALRRARARRTESTTRKLESALDDSLMGGEVHPDLLDLDDREKDLLAILMVEYLSVLSGTEKDRLVGIAEESGLVRSYFDRLGSRDRWRKARAAENLGYFGGPAAVPPLTPLLGHPDETVRAVAARALARIGTREAAESLARTLNDPSELTRLRMAENLERIGTLAVDPLIDTLEGESAGQARVLTARILGYLRASEARQALKGAMLGGQLTDLRAQATLALGKIGNPEDVPALQEAAGDEEWPVRAQAANALEMIGDVSTIPALQDLTLDREWWVRLNASRALANIGPEGERALARVLEVADRYARDRAVATLEERGVTRRVVGELAQPGEKGEGARAMIGAMIRFGSTKYLTRLANTMPDGMERRMLSEMLQATAEAPKGGGEIPTAQEPAEGTSPESPEGDETAGGPAREQRGVSADGGPAREGRAS